MPIRRSLFILVVCIGFFSAKGQNQLKLEDSLLTIRDNHLKAAATVFRTNLAVWSVDRYILKGEWAYINLNTMNNNLKKGFVWDNDMFITNLFAHPYHGGLYFNAARSSGFTFWESVPYSMGGSLMWEFLMENEYPALNDFLSTSFGGASLGEITFRISDLVLDDRTRGFERFKREALLTLISPVRGLNRLLNGDAWKHRTIRGNTMPTVPIRYYAAFGHRFIADFAEENRKDYSNMMSVDLELDYGDPYDSDNELPYDFFSLKVGGNLFSNQPLIGKVNALGMLFAKNIELKKASRQLTIGLFQHFNYYETKADINHKTLNPYKLSEAASFGPGALYKVKIGRKNFFFASAYFSGILLGGSQTDHYRFEERDYNMGSGFSSKLNLEFHLGSHFKWIMNSEDYRLYSWVGFDPYHPENFTTDVQGDLGNSSLTIQRSKISYDINKHLSLGLETSAYYRSSVYRYFEDVEHGVVENKLSLGYTF